MAKRKKIPVNLNLNVRGLKKSATLAINERSRELAAQGKEIFFLGFDYTADEALAMGMVNASIPHAELEVGMLARGNGRRCFRRLSDTEVVDVLAG